MTHTPTRKRAILVVSFGTSYHDTCAKNIGAIENDIAAAFPQWEVRRAFTSGMILRKLRRRDNLQVDTVAEALERLATEGFDTVLCQPTHILNGEEYDDIVRDTAAFAHRFAALRLGKPLLSAAADYQALAATIGSLLQPAGDTALCLMGHGTSHYADSAYAALDYHLKEQGYNNIFVGTVEGYPDLDTLLRQVKRYGAQKVLLTPLMVVAGDHAVNDMAGDEDGSWKHAFEAAGYRVKILLRGLGEYPEIRQMYVKHVRDAMQPLQ